MSKKRVTILVITILFLGTLGVTGYMFIEGWSLEDSFYMTVITLTTTGYGEVHQLSSIGKWFTSFLLIIGVGVAAYSATTIIGHVISGDWLERKRKKMNKKVAGLSGHTIVCGYGRMGKVICEELNEHNAKFVIIEKDKTILEYLNKRSYLWIEGDASEDDTLIQSGIRRAKTLACMIDNDADALYMALAARNLNRNLYIIVRANAESAKKKIIKAGADKVILPYRTSALKVAQSVLNPNVEDFLDITGVKNDDANRIQIFDIYVTNQTNLIGKTLTNCGLKRNQLMVVGIRRPDKKFIFAPSSEDYFKEGDCLIALGTRDGYEAVKQLVKR